MKNLVKLMSVAVFLTANCVNSQTTLEPPTPPTTSTITVENSNSYCSSISDDGRRSSSSSISVKATNSSYKFRANFDNNVTDRVRTFLYKELKSKRFTKSDASFWLLNKNDERAFECKVKKGSVRMYLNKELTSEKFQQEIQEIGERLKYVINGSSHEEAKKSEKNPQNAG